MITSSNDFIHKYNLKYKATSKIKIQQILSPLSLSDVGIYLRDGPFKTDLHPCLGTHCVLYCHECYFDSYGIKPPNKLSKFIIKRKGHCLYFEYNIQGLTSKTKDSY